MQESKISYPQDSNWGTSNWEPAVWEPADWEYPDWEPKVQLKIEAVLRFYISIHKVLE